MKCNKETSEFGCVLGFVIGRAGSFKTWIKEGVPRKISPELAHWFKFCPECGTKVDKEKFTGETNHVSTTD